MDPPYVLALCYTHTAVQAEDAHKRNLIVLINFIGSAPWNPPRARVAHTYYTTYLLVHLCYIIARKLFVLL